VTHGNGTWLVTGAASYAYSSDGIYWTIENSALGSFYGVGFDGIRYFATNPNNGADPAIIYQLLVSSIPMKRQVVMEKGFASAGPDYLKSLPSASALGTDQNGKVIDIELSNAADPAKGAGLVGYKGRAVRDRLSEPGVSVMDHGAVADYVKPTIAAPAPALNTDNQAAFQAAADEAASLGVPLIVPPGSYYLGSKFTCSVDMVIDGEICIDHRTALYNPGHGGGISSLPTAVVWSGSNRVATGAGGFWSPGRHRYDPALPGAVNGGMYCFILMEGAVGAPSVGNLVSGLMLVNGHYGAVMVGSYCQYPWIDNCRFLGNGYQVLYDDMNTAFKSRGSFGIRTTNCIFRGEDWTATATAWATTNNAWGGDPIEYNAPAEGTTDCVADNNDIRECYSASVVGGIGIGLAKVRGFSVCGNYIRRTHHDGIHVEDGSYDGIVSDNKVWLATQGAGSAYITCEKSYGIEFADNICGGGFAMNGGIGFSGPWLPPTSKHVLVTGNYLGAALLIINQSNVTVRDNEVHRVSDLAPSAGNDGIQITAGPATADSDMQNILVEDNRVTGFYRGIAITGDPDCIVSDVRVRNNYAPPNPLSTAPAADKSVYVTQATNVELVANEAIGFNARRLTYATSVPEGVVVGNKGDLISCRTGGTYSGVYWGKVSGDNSTGAWMPLGHLGVFILDRTDGTAITPWARWVRYRGTGGHNFAIAAPTETGRILEFSHNGTGAAITITPASGTIAGLASVSVPVGYVLTIVDANNGTWQIQSMHGISTGWGADTGTAKKTANATYSGTASAGYVQAEMQAAMNALRDATQTIKALKDALLTNLSIAP
jgi:hypothetical protein